MKVELLQFLFKKEILDLIIGHGGGHSGILLLHNHYVIKYDCGYHLLTSHQNGVYCRGVAIANTNIVGMDAIQYLCMPGNTHTKDVIDNYLNLIPIDRMEEPKATLFLNFYLKHELKFNEVLLAGSNPNSLFNSKIMEIMEKGRV